MSYTSKPEVKRHINEIIRRIITAIKMNRNKSGPQWNDVKNVKVI